MTPIRFGARLDYSGTSSQQDGGYIIPLLLDDQEKARYVRVTDGRHQRITLHAKPDQLSFTQGDGRVRSIPSPTQAGQILQLVSGTELPLSMLNVVLRSLGRQLDQDATPR